MSKSTKYCESCGAKNKADAKFCDDCGKPFDKPEKTTGDKPSRVSEGVGLEVVSLVTSILGFTCLPLIGFVIAIITGLMSTNPKENKYAKAGIMIGSLGLIVPFFVLGIIGIIGGVIDGTDDLLWAIILGTIALILSGVGLFFFIRWIRKPAA
ncbi:MAG: zinc-ribbon domain-containing protein [Candidatus Heimdallarchaeota archaeon]|nr:zinc-ribbon domain-containing protein [Candidatus Heimdallarchaeota archaeon]MBY8993758.1 zinc-ribbon domain-containing protein [Candidatus Heimdallarchaeota archaeon]